MKKLVRDSVSVTTAFKHYLLADILFAALLGATFQLIIIYFLRSEAYVVSQGLVGITVEATLTWIAVWISSLFFRNKHALQPVVLVFVATLFSLLTTVISAPYISYFAGIIQTSTEFIIIKDAIHVAIFSIATSIYFCE